jgi:hypothetical protein
MKKLTAVLLLGIAPAAFAQDKALFDYAHPQQYLSGGAQSQVDSATASALSAEMEIPDGAGDFTKLAAVDFWLRDNFRRSAPPKGYAPGQQDAAELFKTRELYGCHEWALAYASALRIIGYPAVMVDAAGIGWGLNYKGDGHFSGHVFVAAKLAGRWVLVEPQSGLFIYDYDPANPVIPLKVGDENSFYALMAGTEPKAYGLKDPSALDTQLTAFAAGVSFLKFDTPQYQILQLVYPRNRLPFPLNEAVLEGKCQSFPCMHRDMERTGEVVQTGGRDIHLEKRDGRYLAHIYGYGRIFDTPPLETKTFPTLDALRAWLKKL